MKRGTLVLPIDRAREFIDLIGASTKMQFEDMNARDLHRPYKKHIQRIDEMERILRFLMDELTRVPGAEVVKSSVDSFLEHADEYKLDDLEARLKQIHQDFIQFKENNVKLTSRRNAALEERYVMDVAIASMTQQSAQQASMAAARNQSGGDKFEFDATRSLLDDEEGSAGRRSLETMFSNMAGVIPQSEQDRFARTLFRATRGNTFTHFQQIYDPMQDPKTGREVHKSVFVIYFQDQRIGSGLSAMHEKINKICNSFGVNVYRWPASREQAEEMRVSLSVQCEDQERLLKAHETFVRQEATVMLEPPFPGRSSLIEEYRLFCMKEKSIYATLNLFEGNMNLRASCWYPAAEEDQIRAMLIQNNISGPGNSSAMLVSDRTSPNAKAPSYVRKNEFTSAFQELVDTYGCPRNGEINPALFAVVTFPFLFGVMYGDVGHGSLLLAVGIYAVWKADELKLKIPELYAYRYILLMMGFFAVYAGFLYNDFFSIGLTLFQSRWTHPEPMPPQGSPIVYEHAYDIKNNGGLGPYPFGLDPAWHGADNELIFMNSLKMKMSVIIGVTQMLLGLGLRFLNATHERNFVDFFCECCPMLVFMIAFFGFMDYCILYKWVHPLANPPSIINSMICMAMWTPDPNPMLGHSLPRMLMLIAMLTVPVMLFPKPLILYMQHKAQAVPQHGHRGGGGGHGQMHGVAHTALSSADEEGCSEREDEEEEFDMAEITIHQVIETIEYVLGTVSHTASYLRLWALSLAHQQLALVFFSYTLLGALASPFPMNVIMIYANFALWLGITIGILCGMDIMECFLHCLRLHWVEFQSKFARLDGTAFKPYCHKSLLEHADD
jgi:V-type H+-transporting ATPase subunit a